MKFLRQYPYRAGLIIWLFFVGVFTVVSVATIPLFWLIDVLIAMNAAAFVIYGIDKLFAIGQSWRVPERILWLSAFMGGPFGAVLGMQIFRHKVSKGSFQFWLAITVFVEIAIIILLVKELGLQPFN